MSDRKIKVLIVDDSAVIRQLLTEIINSMSDMEVVATAQNPLFAVKKIQNYEPDVIILDIEMPHKDGLTFLEELMANDPRPVVMISAYTARGSEKALRALSLGAVDYMEKPGIDITQGMAERAGEVVEKIRVAAKAKVKKSKQGKTAPPASTSSLSKSASWTSGERSEMIIAIGASTGGTIAVTEIMAALPDSLPCIVIAQHMPPVFTKSFAERVNSLSRVRVREAGEGDPLVTGTALIAPGNEHMSIVRNGARGYTVKITHGPMVNYVRPSVDVLFRSVAEYAGKNALGVLLTGMGEDGARGLLAMRMAGAFTIAQDEATSIVYGMPKKAADIGAVDVVAPLGEIADMIVKHMS